MIRPLVAGDSPAVKCVIDATDLFPSEMIDDMARAYLDAQGADEFWLAAGDAEATAVAYCAPERMTEGTWNLYLIAAHPGAQRRGYGANLVPAVEQRVRQARADAFCLSRRRASAPLPGSAPSTNTSAIAKRRAS